jgi:hypothetical protein
MIYPSKSDQIRVKKIKIGVGRGEVGGTAEDGYMRASGPHYMGIYGIYTFYTFSVPPKAILGLRTAPSAAIVFMHVTPSVSNIYPCRHARAFLPHSPVLTFRPIRLLLVLGFLIP